MGHRTGFALLYPARVEQTGLLECARLMVHTNGHVPHIDRSKPFAIVSLHLESIGIARQDGPTHLLPVMLAWTEQLVAARFIEEISYFWKSQIIPWSVS